MDCGSAGVVSPIRQVVICTLGALELAIAWADVSILPISNAATSSACCSKVLEVLAIGSAMMGDEFNRQTIAIAQLAFLDSVVIKFGRENAFGKS